MKKRIIALVLVLVMAFTALVGCGEYDYSDVNLEKYASVNVAGLKDALLNLVVEDGEFTTDEEERNRQTWDLIWRSLANADNRDDTEYKTGTPDNLDLVYFCYFATAVVGEKTHIFTFQDSKGNSQMLSKYATYLQIGLYDNDDDELAKAVISALEGKEFGDYAYEIDTTSSTSNKVEAGDFILVSFTYTLSETTAEGKVNQTEKTVKNLPVFVPAAEGEYEVDAALKDLVEFKEFLNSLVGDQVGKKQNTAYETPEAEEEPEDEPTDEGAGDEATELTTEESTDEIVSTTVKYTDVTIAGRLTSGKALEGVNAVTYPSEEKDDSESTEGEDEEEEKKENLVKDIFGEEVDLTDVVINYSVFPVYYYNVSFGAEEILTIFYGSEITTDALDIFASEDYVYEDKETDSEGNEKPVTKTVKTLIEEFAKLQKKYEEAKTSYDKAKDAYDDAKEALETAQKNYDEAVKVLEDANKRLEDATKDVADKLAAYNAAKDALDALNKNPDATSDEIAAAQTEVDNTKKAHEDAVKQEELAKNYKEEQVKNEASKKEALETAQKKFDAADLTLNGTKVEDDDTTGGETEGGDAATVAEESEEEEDKEEEVVVGETEKFEKATAARDEAVKKILAATKKADDSEQEGSEGTTPKTVAELIVDDFEKACYENLEDGYFEEINKNLMIAVYDAIKKNISVDLENLPRRAVKEFYEKIYETHKYEFFTSANSTASKPAYETYNGDFELYLRTETRTESFKKAKEALEDEAKEYVAEIIKIYAAANALGFIYTDEEFEVDFEKEYNPSLADFYAYYGLEYMTEQSMRNAKQADKLFNSLLETNKDDDGRVKTTDDGLFDYKEIKYTLKED